MADTGKKVSMFVAGLLGLASLATVSSLSLGASNLSGLREICIKPFGDFAIDPGEKLLLAAEGDYVTYTVPVRAAWRIIKGDEYGWLLTTCDSEKNCEFQAGDRGGDVTVSAEYDGMTDEEIIHIRPPAPPKKVENPFNDSIPDWAGEPIVELKNREIIRGYQNGTYGAGDLLTRGQLITIFHRVLVALGMPKTVNCKQLYDDVPPGHYAFEAACAFRMNRWTDALKTLGPDDFVSRGETASLINRVIGPALLEAKDLKLGGILSQGQFFTDVPTDHLYYGDTAVTRATGVMRGNPDRTFGPERTLNRAEAAAIFWRVMGEME